jgi:[ribosomal protein S5]-alanine N-acetyltransferase
MRLEGPTISLTPISLADVNSTYLSWLTDNEVMQGLATTGYTIEKLRGYVASRVNRPDVAFFAIRSNETGEHIGNIKLEVQDAPAAVADLGLLIGNKQYWGKGVGHEACGLAIGYGFEAMKLRKIYLAVYDNNPKARRLYEKLGFKLEGTLRSHVLVNGAYYDKHLMGLFKEEFQ